MAERCWFSAAIPARETNKRAGNAQVRHACRCSGAHAINACSSGIRIVVVRDLAKVEARVRFPYPAPVYTPSRSSSALVPYGETFAFTKALARRFAAYASHRNFAVATRNEPGNPRISRSLPDSQEDFRLLSERPSWRRHRRSSMQSSFRR
jgi:hypothetical protein